MSDKLPDLKFTPLEAFPQKLLAQKTRGGLSVSVVEVQDSYSLRPVIYDQGKVDKLSQSAFAALELEQKISPDFSKSVSLQLVNSGGYMSINDAVSQKMLDDLPECQVAAILHEGIHDLEERFHFEESNQECLPELAEFLFTGKTRLGKYQSMHENYYAGKATGQHERAWGRIVKILLPDVKNQDPDDIAKELLELRRLPKEEKVEIVKKAIENARGRKT